MTTYTLTVTWRDGQTLVGQLRTDDPQRFLRALSRDSEIVEAHATEVPQ